MDGLECSEKMISDLRKNNPTWRIDSEFYLKKYKYLESALSKHPTKMLGELTSWITQGPNPIFTTEKEIPCLTGRNIANGRVDYNNADFVDKNEYESLKRFQIYPGDLLITLKGKGSIGKVGHVTEKNEAIFSRNIGIIRAKGINSTYLYSYFMSKYGSELILRGETGGTGQTTLTTSHLRLLPVPIFQQIPSLIEHVIDNAEKCLTSSFRAFEEAERLLLSTLGMLNFISSNENISIRSLSKSLLVTGRIDAEYYQPKYDCLFDKLGLFKTKMLGGVNGIVDIKKSIEPGSDAYRDEGIPFVRVSDITKYEISNPEIHIPENVVANITTLYPKKDTILFSKDGSVGIAFKMEEDAQIITSGALLHLTVKAPDEVLPDYLTLVLNSPVVQLQAERDSCGAIIQHWKTSEIQKAIIPILDISTQKLITAKIRESFYLRNQSKQLLKTATEAIEIAIEQGEKTAIIWLKEKGVAE
jgi:hypothetical protein